jgi:pyruvate dehydrogenase E1 component alpha subunit
MIRIRKFEERVKALGAAGELGGSHLYLGEEAVAAGVCAALRADDYITSTHRCHGHVIAKGGDLGRSMAELFGRETGYCKGKGGEMHIADMELGIISANGIIAAGLPIANGAGLAVKLRGSDQVSVAFFGDGAASAGAFHESLNLATIWNLPVVFVCENNGWVELTRSAEVTARDGVAQHGEAYGIPGTRVDGNDVFAVHAAAAGAVARARAGEGPSLIEARTYRTCDHSEGLEAVVGGVRTEQELEEWRARDPIPRLAEQLAQAGVSEADLAALEERIESEIDAAVEFARSSARPAREAAYEDMWIESGSAS